LNAEAICIKPAPIGNNMKASPATVEFRKSLAANASVYGVALAPGALDALTKYYEILNAWNARIHLVAPCSPSEFATRHVLESLLLLKYLPAGAKVAEVGAGAGLPIIPCLIARADLRSVLIEASQKKSVFLREALRATDTSPQASVIAERFERVATFDGAFVTCRALERFEAMLPLLLQWAPADATLLLFGGARLAPRLETLGFPAEAELLPNSTARFLFREHKRPKHKPDRQGGPS
jgi:16S rRNA (guanine527-N7)-methyltransferase